MLDLRTLVLGVAVFGATFLVGWWLNIGTLMGAMVSARPAPAATVGQSAPASQAAPAAPANHKVAVHAPQAKAVLQGKGLVQDKLTRDAVVSWSKAYQNPSCNQDVRSGYTNAVTKYAEALMRSAGCNNFPRCPMSMGQLERVWHENRSALDMPVAEAMAAAHAAGGLSEKNFRGDVGRVVRVIAGRDFEPGPAPDCKTQSSRSTWSFRIRRR
jgi:hypothetical protein